MCKACKGLIVPHTSSLKVVEPGSQTAAPSRDTLSFRVSRLQARLNADAAQVLRAHGGLSLTQWRIFDLLDTHGEQTAACLVRHSHIDKAQISRAVRDMIAGGLLNQRPSPSDQRAALLSFSEAGWQCYTRARPHMQARQARLRGALSAEELRVFQQALAKLDAALDRGA